MLIERLSGTYLSSIPTGIILDVNGVGYGVEMPLSSLCKLPEKGAAISIWTHTYVREDSIKLFGFFHYQERLAFELLIGLNGVGPKVALAILSTLSVPAIKEAAIKGQSSVFEVVPGVGKRTAEKILVDLKPKIKKLDSSLGVSMDKIAAPLDSSDFVELGGGGELPFAEVDDSLYEDLRSALENFGFKEKVIGPLLEKLKKTGENRSFQDLMKAALVEISGNGKSASKENDKNQGVASISGDLF